MADGVPMSSTSTSERPRVPVEDRVGSLDRRAIPFAIAVVVFYLVTAVVLPWVNDALEWDDPVRAGERLTLTDTISFAPATGWQVEEGTRVGEPRLADEGVPATVVGRGVTFTVTTAAFDGTPAELLAQVEKYTSDAVDPTFQVTGDASTVSTLAGDTGVVQPYSSVQGDGVAAAFVVDGFGVEVLAYGPTQRMHAAADDVNDMIASIRTDGDEQ